jgi:ribosomal protein L7/L12
MSSLEFSIVLFFVLFLIYGFRTQTKLAQIERKIDRLARQLDIDLQPELQLSERVRQLASDPNSRIAAIKLYRQETGASLKDAKDVIDQFSDPRCF